MSTVTEINEYMERANGERARGFAIDGVSVLVTGEGDQGRRVTAQLHDAASAIARLERELAEARALIPPKTATRLLTAGCVRERDAKVWLMNKRESGWASFAFCMGTWDSLFRHYDVEVYEAGIDESGGYWMVRNREARP